MNLRIETKNLMIRNFIPEDGNAAFSYLSDPEVMKYIEQPFTEERTIQFIEECGLRQQMIFAVKEKKSGELIGHIIFHPFDSADEYELGWILGRKYWGNGYAVEISAALIQMGFAEMRLSRLIAETTTDNRPARKILETLKFKINEHRSGNYLLLYELEKCCY